MRARPMRGWAALLLAAGLALGCDKDPHDAQTWIDKLDDPREVDEAVRNLERLHDPKSVKSLGELWKKMNRPSKVLSVIINVAGRVHTKDDPNGEHHHVWTDAVPYLTEAVESFEVTDERSIADATLACEALGKAADPSTLQVLIGAAQKSTTSNSPANRVRIAAVRALGKFKDPRAVVGLFLTQWSSPKQPAAAWVGPMVGAGPQGGTVGFQGAF